jgi:predicted nucleic acid-binding protein
MSVEFCDTNVIVYAYDSTAGVKHDRAQALLERLWLDGKGVLSVQVLQELFVTLTRKVARPVDPGEARAIVADLATWSLVQPAASDVLAAIDATIRWQLSFWDAMILTAAQRAGAAVLWSEDFSDGQRFDAVTVRNPFAA